MAAVFLYLQRVSGLGMDTCEESLTASKADNPIFISGPGPPMSKGPCQHSVSSRARLRSKCYQETRFIRPWKLNRGFMRPAILHGFGEQGPSNGYPPPPSRLEELAQFGWLPLAAALFGTPEWQPQWLHHNFLPVIGLRVHAKIPPSPLSYQQQVALLGLWERRPAIGTQCWALAQAAELTFGLPTVFRAPEEWTTEVKGEVFDLVQCSQRIYTGDAAANFPTRILGCSPLYPKYTRT